MGNRNKSTAGTRKRVQAVFITAGQPPDNMPRVAGFVFADGATAPDNMQHVSSAAYSLGSPTFSGARQIAVISYSLSSPAIPDGLKRVAILPET